MHNFTTLTAYKKAFDLAMRIFELSKSFPKEERYSLTDQIRRSSRSVAVNIAEGYRKKMYDAYFVSKASDADMENSETQVWLDFALACQYLSQEQHNSLIADSSEVGKLINHMIKNPTRYTGKR